MTVLAVTLVSLCAAFAAIQLALALRVRASVPPLSAIDAPPPRAWPRLSIIVPARNEAPRIEAALSSKLRCGYENLEVVVVDDRSTDDTGAIAARLARADPRLVVMRVDTVPPGWLGKLHAMAIGAARATGDWLLFSDADVHVAPDALARIVAHAEAHDVDFVSVLPRMDPTSVLLDAFAATIARAFALGGRTWRANDDRSSVGVGVGAFNLVRRRALENSPGLGYLRMEIADDVALGAMLKASGARCRLFAARADVHLAFAATCSELLQTGEKLGFVLGFSLIKAALATGLWLAVDLAVPIAAIACGGPIAALGALALAFVTAAHVILARHFDTPGAHLWPLGSILGAALLARAGVLAWRRGAIIWRGTRYDKAVVRAGRRWVGGRVSLDAGLPSTHA